MRVVRAKGEIGKDGSLRVDLPTGLPAGPVELVVIVDTANSPPNGSAYDFTDFAGKLSWQSDAVAAQRRLRDEW